jgi:plasmid stabilization system protein ParE
MTVQRQLEEILQIIEEEIGQDQAKRVLRAIVERFGGAASSEHGATLRLVAG